jgi:hypothetical protein
MRTELTTLIFSNILLEPKIRMILGSIHIDLCSEERLVDVFEFVQISRDKPPFCEFIQKPSLTLIDLFAHLPHIHHIFQHDPTLFYLHLIPL